MGEERAVERLAFQIETFFRGGRECGEVGTETEGGG